MDQMAGLHGHQFDLMFIDMLTRHHQGAIDAAREELARGQDTSAQELATAIITAQQRAIDQAATWRKAWAASAQ
jgi:uncharacterized protein (DUF305 family)